MISIHRAREAINASPRCAVRHHELLFKLLTNRASFEVLVLKKPQLLPALYNIIYALDIKIELEREAEFIKMSAAEFILGTEDAQAAMEEKLRELGTMLPESYIKIFKTKKD